LNVIIGWFGVQRTRKRRRRMRQLTIIFFEFSPPYECLVYCDVNTLDFPSFQIVTSDLFKVENDKKTFTRVGTRAELF
jgi:hypothetical protein